MDWAAIGMRIRKQREQFGYTRENFAEMLNVTPKFCADIELGNKGMSVQTLCKISDILKLSTDYILFGSTQTESTFASQLLQSCTPEEQKFAEDILKTFVLAMDSKKN